MRRRAGIVLCILFLLFFGIIVRIALITVDDSVQAVGSRQGSKTLTIAETRGTIYDRNLKPLTNAENAYYATILPEERLLQRLYAVTELSEFQRLSQDIAAGIPLVAKLTDLIAITDGLRVYMAPERYSNNTLAAHLIGYLNGANQGVGGIEAAYNEDLNRYAGHITATFLMNGRGTYLADDKLLVENTTAHSSGGVVLTLDSNLQEVVEKVASKHIRKGAVVVLNAQSGDILASASYPTFHPTTVAKELDTSDGALTNRVLAQFDCGSVFKIVTALAALESGVPTSKVYECTGGMTIDTNTFHCHYRLGHQALNMEEAFAQSCNLYFIQLAADIGADALLAMADKLGLNESIHLADPIIAPASVIPTQEDLTAPSALANISFGQGKLLVTPLHIARMTAAIASGGTLFDTRAVLGTVNEQQQWTSTVEGGGETVISAYATKTMQFMMEQVVQSGTGQSAQPQSGKAAGKTGTAETGQRDKDRPIVHSWFTGYYPADNPQYVITVLIEDYQNNSPNAATVFCEFINNLM